MRENEKKKLSTQPYKGVRDFYPEVMFVQNYILETMKRVSETFGYIEYSSSILEPAELYEAKSSEEIVNEQTYTFTDRGNRRVTLRPEMTPSLARLIAAKKRELSFPLRWYSVPNVFRYERPQRGRLREHWQLNCDIFGVSGIESEVEIISLAHAVMKGFGAKNDDFEIRVNNRKSLSDILNKHDLTEEKKRGIYRLLDKKDQVKDFDKQMSEITEARIDFDMPIDSETETLMSLLKDMGVPNVTYSPTLVRGLEYYTGIVFEVFDTSPENNRALFGGGRYDNLLDIFGVESVPAVGFGMGDVTLRDFLETHNLLPEYAPPTKLYIATTENKHISFAQKLANKLRAEGISVAVNLLNRKLGEQIKNAVRQSIPYLLVVGEEEIESKTYKLKALKAEAETVVKEEDIAKSIQSGGV